MPHPDHAGPPPRNLPAATEFRLLVPATTSTAIQQSQSIPRTAPGARARIRLVGLIAGGKSGIPRYAALLARSIDRVAAEFPMLQITLVTSVRGASVVDPHMIDVHVLAGPAGRMNAGPGRLLAEQIAAAHPGADLLHFFDLSGPLFAPSRMFVATAHDASAAHCFRRRDAYKHSVYRWTLRHAARVIAVSAFAKEEVLRHFGGDASRIDVVHSGPGFEPLDNASDRTRPTSSPYLLFVAGAGANKNPSFLIRAFERARVSADLVVAGLGGRMREPLRTAVSDSPVRDRIRFVAGASDVELDALYWNAAALLLPSSYEGFGFPALEAMSRRCPVLASDIPALREVSGSGAMLLPLNDLEAWAAAIRQIVQDDELRSELRERGAETVSRFSWDATARDVCRIFAAATHGDEKAQLSSKAR